MVSATSNMYLQGLADTSRLVDKAVKGDTMLTRRRHIKDCMEWLANYQLPKNMQTLTPEDRAVYLTQHWLPTHAGSTADNGSTFTSSSTQQPCTSSIT